MSDKKPTATRRQFLGGAAVATAALATGELLHPRCPVEAIQFGDLVVKRDRRILPPHVVDEKEDDVGAFRRRRLAR